MELQPLPEFDAPPVEEVALGVEFPQIDGWRIPHFGLFWQQIRADYPAFDVQPPVPSQIESPTILPREPGHLRLSFDPNNVRCWFLDETKNNLLQVQPDRFLRNWRQVTGDEAYPRYAVLRPAFERDWHRFLTFLSDNQLPAPSVAQCEVTYINNIERGAGWDSFDDLSRVTPLWAGRVTDGFLQHPESTTVALSYGIENQRGRLRIMMNHALRLRDGKEILQLQLVARGKPASEAPTDVLSWLDLGREWIVRAFADTTTPAMHTIWKRRA
jgi:uncharacterized protein (TIGR04255 family)